MTVHPYVYKVVLTGSRGLAGNYRADSDLDLSLLLDGSCLDSTDDEETILKDILETILSSWQSPIELDVAVVFDISNCRLACFDCETADERPCRNKGIDCFGLYKTQKGFHGYVPKIGVAIDRAYPMIAVYARKRGL